MSGVSSWQANLAPPGRVASARSLTLARFLSEQEARALLLVRLKNETSKFIATLTEVDAEPRDPLSDLLDTKTGIGEPLGETWPSELAHSFDEEDLAGLAENTRYFAVAIRKRAGFENHEPDRITMGRARDLDVVLSSPTVSKLHAWLEIDEDGKHWLTDKGSRNGTRINGQRLSPDRPAALAPGDRIDLGLVRAVYCPAVTFWRALHVA